MTGEALAVPENGPFAPTRPIPELTNLYENRQLVPWLVYVGLGGRYCWAVSLGWMRWDGKKWKRTRIEHVNEAVRRALSGLHGRSEGLPGRDYLLSLDQTFTMTRRLRETLAVDPAELGIQR
ncbi:hypothetical protein [Aeromicrobium endophyticum]|uniref:Uncharacterized protein n=1 Tax=Aeromicrobium endophyticum TaxID=2292704 RepID=A0A371P828_9ACTN|nr:hypothetical protein [Aeromicrobium endophyticum]REK72134.1 hypothetical protein DX116_00320 [Aeromicrobium endophyticum]